MAELLWHISASLDGYVAGPGDDMTWMAGHAGPNPAVTEVLGEIGAVLMGGRTYRLASDPGGRPYGGAWTGPIVVLTSADPGTAADGYAFESDLRAAVAAAAEAAGDGCVAVFGPTTAHALLDAGLLDEVLIHVVPVLLGAGVPLFRRGTGDTAPGAAVRFEPVATTVAGAVVNHRLRVLR